VNRRCPGPISPRKRGLWRCLKERILARKQPPRHISSLLTLTSHLALQIFIFDKPQYHSHRASKNIAEKYIGVTCVAQIQSAVSRNAERLYTILFGCLHEPIWNMDPLELMLPARAAQLVP
jgi:hypothetical protein